MPLTATKLSFAYSNDRPVLRDISVGLTPGKITVLLGPNGSGKSTLLKLLLGHPPPATGQVLWNDQPLRALRPRELARQIAYLPQSPAHDPGQTVAEVLRAGRTPYLGPLGLESDRDLDVVRQTAD